MATGEPIKKSFWERKARVLEQRKKELQQMEQYARLKSGHMEFLVRALDGEIESFQPPGLTPLPKAVRDAGAVTSVNGLLRRWKSGLRPHTRLIWPDQIAIPRRGQAEHGQVLCELYRSDLGEAVREGLEQQHFEGSLVEAMTDCVLRDRASMEAFAVTYVPSAVQAETDRIRNFAKRLAAALDLSFLDSLRYAWSRDIHRDLKPGETHLVGLVTTPEDPHAVTWERPLHRKLSRALDQEKLVCADRIAVYCRPEQHQLAEEHLTAIAGRLGCAKRLSLWNFHGPEQSGCTAVMLFPGSKPLWRMSLNSLGQAISYSTGLKVDPAQVPDGSVILVNDLLEYGWSFTYAAGKLIKAGNGKVFPFALASTGKW